MKARCNDPNHPRYADWGGRGIYVCDRWNADFSAFYADMGDKPKGHTLDRIDNDGPYSPENCRWATPFQQAHNSRPRTYKNLVEYRGERHTMADWCRITGAKYSTLQSRLERGWPIGEAMATGRRYGGQKLDASSVLKIRAMHATGSTREALGAMFGVTPVQIRNVVSRACWKHV